MRQKKPGHAILTAAGMLVFDRESAVTEAICRSVVLSPDSVGPPSRRFPAVRELLKTLAQVRDLQIEYCISSDKPNVF